VDSSALLGHELAYVLGQIQDPHALPILASVLADRKQHPMVRHEVRLPLLARRWLVQSRLVLKRVYLPPPRTRPQKQWEPLAIIRFFLCSALTQKMTANMFLSERLARLRLQRLNGTMAMARSSPNPKGGSMSLRLVDTWLSSQIGE
jgi:hypothetical protein